MGPAAWFAVAKALALPLAGSLLTGNDNVFRIIAKEINRCVIRNDIENAKAILRDMAWRYKKEFKAFINQHSGSLPAEAVDELKSFLEE